MNFGNPNILWFLLVLPPALVAFFWWSWRKHQSLVTQFIQARLLPSLTIGISPTRQKIKLVCLLLAVTCLIVALARPQWGFAWEEVKQKGLDIVVAIDVSKSMLAEDIAPNRLARAKLAALDLMQQAKSDRLGLVAFAGSAFLQCPLTIDDSAFRQSVESLDVNVIPEGGTALAEAIQTAQGAYKEGENHRILVIFTDGEDQDSGAVEAAKKAGEDGLQIFTMGVGSSEGEILRIKDAKGRSDYIRDEQGNVVKSHLNEGLLREIAGATQKGFYLPLRGAQAVDTLYREGLAPLPKSESGEKLVRRYHERYHWPLGLAMLFLIVEMLIPERRQSNAGSSRAERQPAKPALAKAAALVLCLVLGFSASASPSSALREYNAGKYDQSLKEYEKLIQKNKDDPRLHFNAGAAAYRSGQYEEAQKQFNEALNSSDLKLLQQTYYNRGNTLYNLGATNPEPEKRTKSWEEALKDFESTLQLNRQDADAKHNYEFVKRKLEELKQQQQQQKQQNKDNQDQKDDQKQDQEQQNQQAKNDKDKQSEQDKSQPNKKDQQQQDQKNQQARNEKQDQEQKEKEQQKQASNKQKDQKEQQQKEQQQKQQQANASKDKDQSQEKGEQSQSYAVGQMTPQQAQQLLDAQKNEEMLLPIKPEGKPQNAGRQLKDW